MSRLRIILKWVLVSLTLVATIWLAVIVWWQTTQRVVTMQDTVLYLAALPLALLGCIGLLKWLIRRRGRNASSAPDEANPETPAEPPAPQPGIRLPILSVWALTNFAADPDEFARALRERQVRPGSDAALSDEQGFPLLTGRIADLDTTQIRHQLIQMAVQQGFEVTPDMPAWRDAFLRTIALLDRLLDQVLDLLPLDPAALGKSPTDPAANASTLRGAAPAASGPDERLRLKVELLLPAHFAPFEQQLAHAYLLQRASHLPVPNSCLQVSVVHAADDATALATMDRFGVDSHGDQHAHALLMLACESTLCETIAQQWQASDCLFNPRCATGLMMGEAAFAVLCANAKALQAAPIIPQCTLTRLSRAQRATSADTQGKPSHTCLTEVVKDALTAASLQGDDIGSVACDADHRTHRTLECMGVMMEQTPHLDAVQNRLAVAEACGHIGAASVLGAVVAAVIQSKDSEQPVLLFNVSHATDRAAAVLAPFATSPQ